MTEPATEWLTIPELVDALGLPQGRVRRLIEDRHLLALRVDGVLKDSGFTDEEAMRWLLEPEESIGIPPIEALRAGRKAEVRRVAQALGF